MFGGKKKYYFKYICIKLLHAILPSYQYSFKVKGKEQHNRSQKPVVLSSGL